MGGAGFSDSWSCCGGDWTLLTGPGTQGGREEELPFVGRRPSVPGTSEHVRTAGTPAPGPLAPRRRGEHAGL